MMKKISLFYSLLYILYCQGLVAQPLTIIEQDYNQAKSLAAEQQKLLLIDFYTTWCGPCKLLDKQVFQDSNTSKKIAGDFIVLRYNAEKDSVYQLTKKHHIGMYPSAVILNAQERVVHQQYGTGGGDKELVVNYLAFLAKAKSLHRNGFFIKGVSTATQMDYPSFYANYINRTEIKNIKKMTDQYWDTLSNLKGEIPFKVFCYFGGGNEKQNQYFLQHKKEFEKLFGETDVNFATSMIISDKAFGALQSVNRAAFDSAMTLVKTYQAGKDAKRYIEFMEQRMLQAEGRWADAYTYLESLKKKKRASGEDIIRFCDAAFNKCEDKAVLGKSLVWMKAVADREPGYENLALYGRLLFKTGHKEESLDIMKKAIEAGKQMNEDTKEEEAWIRRHFS